jgi:type IV pilus assembly protein PilX
VKSLEHSQRGIALLVSLILLLLLTVLAITAASTSSLQQRMAGNAQEQNIAFQVAETGLATWIALFEAGDPIPDPDELQASGNANAEYTLEVAEQANCLAGSLGVGSGFVFNCQHVTSNAESETGARARHQMGYLTREGQ